VALLGLVALSWHLPQWQYGSRSAGVRSAAWVCAIVLSLSRTASAIALSYVAVAVALQMMVSTRRFIVRVPLVALASVLLLAGIHDYIPFEERFFTGDTSMNVGGFDVNASGRLDIWAIVIESGQRSPVFGSGLGSSNKAVADLGERVGHPHNDYLRVWHDLGFVGVTLLLAAFGTWITTLRRAWLVTRKRAPELAALQLAGYLGLLALMLSAVTDNALVYPYVMGPLGVLIGAGLGVSDGRSRT
jgi:O-antigen ligase